MNIVALGVSMPLSRFMTDLFPIFAFLSLPSLLVVVLLQIIIFAQAGAFSDSRRNWIAPSIILTVVIALFLRLVFYMVFADMPLLSPYLRYGGFLTLHVLLSSALAGFLFTRLVLGRAREYQPLRDVPELMRNLALSCLLMLLPGALHLIVRCLHWLTIKPWLISFYTFFDKVHAPLYFIAFPAFIWHLHILKHLVEVTKKSKLLWVGSGIIYWSLPTLYYAITAYLFSIGRYHMGLDYRLILVVMIICVIGSMSVVRSVRRMVREQLRYEEFLRESE
jgi:hypothetical protein